MNRNLIIVIVVAVGAAYLFIGPDALYGLVAVALGFNKPKTTGEKVAVAENEAERSEEQVDIHLAESAKDMNEAKESQQEAVDIAESITVPDHEVKSGRTRKSFSSS